MNFCFKKIPTLSFLAITTLTALLITAIGIYFSPLSLPFLGEDNAVNQVTNSQNNENYWFISRKDFYSCKNA